MDMKLSPSNAAPRGGRACAGGFPCGNRKSTAGAGANCKRSSGPMAATENSKNVSSQGSGKENNVGFQNSIVSVSGKPHQHSDGGADAGRKRNPGPKYHVLSNSGNGSSYPSPSSLASSHQPRSSTTPCSNREASMPSLAVGGLCHADPSQSSKVVDNHKPLAGTANATMALPGWTTAHSLGNIYKRVVNTDVCSKEGSKVNVAAGAGGYGFPSKEVQHVQKNSNVLGLGGGNYGHGNIIKGGNLPNHGPAAKSVAHREVLDMCPSRGGATCCKNMEELKTAGNEEYKKGHFAEAISFYDKAVALCPRNAACHNNKAAALAGLGLYEEAVGECLEAISCDASYTRAHYRLGNLYARLGRVEDAKWYLKLSGDCPGSEAMQKIQQIETHVINAKNARSAENWNLLLTESSLAIESGADASSQILAFKAEALLRLHKADEALVLLMVDRDSRLKKSSKVHKCDACLLIIEIQIYMYLGRFEDAVAAAEYLVGLDARPESLMWLRNARAVADARKTGNELYRAQKYSEACNAYELGLQYAPPHDLVLGEEHRSPVLRTARREERHVRAALVVIFLVTFLEMLSYSRLTGHGLRRRRLLLLAGLVQTLVYAVQVGLAHLLMLALMSLNVGVDRGAGDRRGERRRVLAVPQLRAPCGGSGGWAWAGERHPLRSHEVTKVWGFFFYGCRCCAGGPVASEQRESGKRNPTVW